MASLPPPTKVQLVTIDDASVDQRLDNFLMKRLKGVPKSRVYRIIRKGEVRINKKRASPETKLQAGDVVRIPPIRLAETQAATPSTYWGNVLGSAIIRETPEYLFINKPRGLAVHGGSGQSAGLIEQLRLSRPKDKQLELVHRIDKETSGVLVVARKRSALRRLQSAWREGSVDKTYSAIVLGDYNGLQRIELPLRKHITHGGDRRIVVDWDEGKPSVTEVNVVERMGNATLIEARLLTGRMHQIRCHLASVGYPLIGDDKYGDFAANAEYKRKAGIDRMCLHAAELGWPEAQWEVRAPLPAHFTKALNELRKG
jgi:23S rRNA pseudouridine955/2504/2580 synthase